MIVAGLDLSLTATGFVSWSTTRNKALTQALFKTKLDKNREYDAQKRIDFLLTSILGHLDDLTGSELRVGIEDHAFGAVHSDTRVHELGGIVKMELWRRGVPFMVLSSQTVKKDATGNGRASKDQMVEAALAEGFTAGSNHNLADAYFVAKLAAKRFSGVQ